MGIIADIDVWNNSQTAAELFIEVKAQKVPLRGADPAFHLSLGEWRSHTAAAKAKVPYQIWLFQYKAVEHFDDSPGRIEFVVFDTIDNTWLLPNSYFVIPGGNAGSRHHIG